MLSSMHSVVVLFTWAVVSFVQIGYVIVYVCILQQKIQQLHAEG